MKADLIHEIETNHGNVLLHDEDSTTFQLRVRLIFFLSPPPTIRLVTSCSPLFLCDPQPYWENLAAEDVQTSLEVFQLEGRGQIDFLRVPVTDEQAPIPEVFDIILQRVNQVAKDTDLVFNCQMGRGRTTTAMISSSLVVMVEGYLKSKTSMIGTTSPLSPIRHASMSLEQKERFLQGEYKVVLNLLRVLPFGPLSKLLVDQAVDKFSHVQNLREAIYDMKIRYEALDAKSAQKQESYTRAKNYLMRYFYLIVFAAFLLEQSDLSFCDWLLERSEIGSVGDDVSSDFEN